MKSWGAYFFLLILLFACESKKEKNAFLFILSFDPLDYFSTASDDFGSGLNLDSGSVITTPGDGSAAVSVASILSQDGAGLLVTDSADVVTSLTTADIEAFFNLNSNGRQAIVSVAQQNVQSCYGIGAISNVTCSLAGFAVTIGSSLFSSDGQVDLQIGGTNLDGDPVSSNTLTAKRYKLRRVSAAAGVYDAQSFVTHNSKLYFNGNADASNSYLVSYDGTELKQVANLGGTQNDDAFPIASYGGNLILSGNDVNNAYNLYKYNGTTITKIIDLNGGSGDTIGKAVEFDGNLYVSIAGAGTSNIYRYNGTSFSQITNDAVNSSLIVAVADDGVYYLGGAAPSLYRINPGDSVPNRRITDATFGHSGYEYFVLGGKLYFTALYGGNDQMFMVDGTDVKRVSAYAMTNISVYNDVAYGIRTESGLRHLYRYTGTDLERLNPDSITLSNEPSDTPVLATASGVYFVRDTVEGSGNVNELYRYQSRRFEKLFSLEGVAAGTTVARMYEFADELFLSMSGGSERLFKIELQD